MSGTAWDLVPSSIEWRGPESTKVILDEDGVQLRFTNGGLEEPDLDRLLAVVDAAKLAKANGSTPTPRTPTREERRDMTADYRRHAVVAAAIRALKSEDDPF
jgi:hypothetical protein